MTKSELLALATSIPSEKFKRVGPAYLCPETGSVVDLVVSKHLIAYTGKRGVRQMHAYVPNEVYERLEREKQ